MTLKRRNPTTVIVGAIVALIASAGSASAADKLRVGKAVAPPFVFQPVDVGMEKGIFPKYNIECEIIGFAGEARMHQGMTAGALDIALGSGPGMGFIVKGVPQKAVGALYGNPDNFGIIVLPDSPLKGAQDLKGKTVSVSSTAALTYWFVKELSNRMGWGPDGIKPVPLGADTAQIAALKARNIDASGSAMDATVQLVANNEVRQIVNYGDHIKHFISNVIYASNDLIAKNPDAVRRFLKAWYETVAWMNSHKEETIAIVGKTSRTPPPLMGPVYDVHKKEFSTDGKFNREALEYIKGSLLTLKILDEAPDMSKLYTEEFLPKPGS
jgi:ABC-type nitrate/sulfonate/bicarbonate transport system substrate-binding protein